MKKTEWLILYRARWRKFKRLLKDLRQFEKNDDFNKELDALLEKYPLQPKYPSFPKPRDWDYHFPDIPFEQLRLILPEEKWKKFCNRWRLDFLSLLLIRSLPFVVRAVAIEWKDPEKRTVEWGMNICIYKFISKNMLKACLEEAHNIIVESCGWSKKSFAGAPRRTGMHSEDLSIYKELNKLTQNNNMSKKEAIRNVAKQHNCSQGRVRNIAYPRRPPLIKNNDVKVPMDCIHIPMTKYEKSEYMVAILSSAIVHSSAVIPPTTQIL